MGPKKYPEKYIKFIIYLILIILVNVAATTVSFRIDLTKDKIFSLSDASRKAVSTLSEPLTIKVFFSKNLPAPHNNTEQYLRDILEEYSLYSNQYFNYNFYNVSVDEDKMGGKNEENRILAQNYGIEPVQIQSIEEDEIKLIKAYMGLVMIHGDLIEKIPMIASTEGLEYKLTTTIKKMNNKISALLNLEDKIRIKLFLSSSLNSVASLMGLEDLSGLPDKIKSIVEKLNNKNYGKLEFAYYDPAKDKSAQDSVKKYNIMNLKWPAQKDKIKAGTGAIGIVMEYKNKITTIPLLHIFQIPLFGLRYELVDISDLKEIINQNVESLININENIGYLADHGCRQLFTLNTPEKQQQFQAGVSGFKSLISQNYSIKGISLEKEDISKSLKCLIIAGPKEKFTDYELFSIDQFLMQGNNLALLLDTYKEVKPAGRMAMSWGLDYIPIDTGLEKMLRHYGIDLPKSYILDHSCVKQRDPREYGGGRREIFFAPVILNKNINNEPKYMQNIKELIVFKVSPVIIDEEKMSENNISVIKLFSSSKKSWEMSKKINLNPLFITPPESDDKLQSYPLAYMLEGEFPSYFAGKKRPVKRVEKKDGKESELDKTDLTNKSKENDTDKANITTEEKILQKSRGGKIFIIASSEMITDNLIDKEGKTPNSTFVMNVIDHLNDRDQIAVMRSKKQKLNPLNEIKASTKSFIKTFNIAAIPVFVIFFGVMVWAKRISKKKYIQSLFKEER